MTVPTPEALTNESLYDGLNGFWLKQIAIQLAAINENIGVFVYMNTYLDEDEENT